MESLKVAFMMLVNDPGNGNVSYWSLEHAGWNGWTPIDLVFLTFLDLGEDAGAAWMAEQVWV